MKVIDQTMHALEKSLDYSAMKNKTISNNIANVDTPNYKAQDVSFQSMLEEASNHLKMKNTHQKHFLGTKTDHSPQGIVTNRHTMYNHNGNNVDIDKEMADLAENQLFYQSLVDRLNGKYQTLQTVIRGGK